MAVVTNEIREPALEAPFNTEVRKVHWLKMLAKHGPAAHLALSTEAEGQQLTVYIEANLLTRHLLSKGGKGMKALKKHVRAVGFDQGDYETSALKDLFRLVFAADDAKLLQMLCYLLGFHGDRHGLVTTDIFVKHVRAEAA